MGKKKTKLKKSTEIMNASISATWCVVNIDNEFKFEGNLYHIDDKVKEYKVFDKAGETENYTNKSDMDLILVTKDTDNHLKYYNQNFEIISNKYIKRR